MTDSRKFSYQTDGLGSVLNLTDSLGVKSNTYSYTAFGTTKAQTGTAINPWLYTGRQHDSESGLYFNRNRYYNPGLGRFMTIDPVGLRGGINYYAYVKNNPTIYTDPLGLMSIIMGDPAAGGGYYSRPLQGVPGSTVYGPEGSRTYGPDGFPVTDVDTGHRDHGHGSPHAHDWGRPKGGKPKAGDRGPGRPVKPGDPVPTSKESAAK